MSIIDWLFGSADDNVLYRKVYNIPENFQTFPDGYTYGETPQGQESIPYWPVRHSDPPRTSYYASPRNGNDEAEPSWARDTWFGIGVDLCGRMRHAFPRSETCWDVLGVSPSASSRQITKAYHQAAREAHPDMGGSSELFNRISAAYHEAMNGRG